MKRSVFGVLFCLTAVLHISSVLAGEPKLHGLFTDNVVLQRDIQLPVWGTSLPDDKIIVSFSGQTKEAVADQDGKWMVRLDPLKGSSEAQTMTVSSSTIPQSPNLQITNILVGDVWLCSGQSNMAWPIAGSKDADKEIKEANYPQIRFFQVKRAIKHKPESDLPGTWSECSPEKCPRFSAVGYFFGREIHKRLGIPVGLINSSVDGTPAGAWTSSKTLEASPELTSIIDGFNKQLENYPEEKEQYDKALADWNSLYDGKRPGDELPDGKKVPVKPRAPLGKDNYNAPAVLYNGMISVLMPFAIKGVIWYQGEANSGSAAQYRTLLPALIGDWRKNWGQGDFPFLIVQLANYRTAAAYPSARSLWAELREAQYLTSVNVPDTGLAVTIDIGETTGNIHPANKQDVGLRLALAARKIAYGEKELVASGPTYESMQEGDGQLRITFSNVGSGLEAKGGELKAFAISDGSNFVWAKALIEAPKEAGKAADSVIVSSDEIKNPMAVRYAWEDNPEGCNLYNKEGLPAVPFRTDIKKDVR